MRLASLVIVCLSLFWSCAPTRFVEPLNEGEHAVQGSLGGPLTRVSGVGVVPLPITSLGYGYGVTDRFTAFGALHPTAAYLGIIQFEAGGTYSVLGDSLDFDFSISPGITAAADVWEGNSKIWPHFDVNFYWKCESRV